MPSLVASLSSMFLDFWDPPFQECLISLVDFQVRLKDLWLNRDSEKLEESEKSSWMVNTESRKIGKIVAAGHLKFYLIEGV